MGCSVRWTATVAAFMATKPSGGPDWHPERKRRAAAKRRTAGSDYFGSRWKGPKGRRKIVGPKVARPDRLTADRPLEGRGAVL